MIHIKKFNALAGEYIKINTPVGKVKTNDAPRGSSH